MLHRHRLIFLHVTLGSYNNDFMKKDTLRGPFKLYVKLLDVIISDVTAIGKK